MKSLDFIIFIPAFIFMCFNFSDGLECIQCVAAMDDGACISDFKGMVNTSLGLNVTNNNRFYKKCANHSEIPNRYNLTHEYCVIEAYYKLGAISSFIRDCSDGLNFSFSTDANRKAMSNKIFNILPDNYTTCIFHQGEQICVTLCEGDYCNAPRPPPPNETLCVGNGTDNETCGAMSMFFTVPGPFGSVVDHWLGRAYVVPFTVGLASLVISSAFN